MAIPKTFVTENLRVAHIKTLEFYRSFGGALPPDIHDRAVNYFSGFQIYLNSFDGHHSATEKEKLLPFIDLFDWIIFDYHNLTSNIIERIIDPNSEYVFWAHSTHIKEDIRLGVIAILSSLNQLLLSMRNLLVNGFEESSKSLMRSYVERAYTLTALLIDEDFISLYFTQHDSRKKARSHWSTHLSFGRIFDRLQRISTEHEKQGYGKLSIVPLESHFKDFVSNLSSQLHGELDSILFYNRTLKDGNLHRFRFPKLGGLSMFHRQTLISYIQFASSFTGSLWLLIENHFSLDIKVKDSADLNGVVA